MGVKIIITKPTIDSKIKHINSSTFSISPKLTFHPKLTKMTDDELVKSSKEQVKRYEEMQAKRKRKYYSE